jgi:hypothetical protein
VLAVLMFVRGGDDADSITPMDPFRYLTANAVKYRNDEEIGKMNGDYKYHSKKQRRYHFSGSCSQL